MEQVQRRDDIGHNIPREKVGHVSRHARVARLDRLPCVDIAYARKALLDLHVSNRSTKTGISGAAPRTEIILGINRGPLQNRSSGACFQEPRSNRRTTFVSRESPPALMIENRAVSRKAALRLTCAYSTRPDYRSADL